MPDTRTIVANMVRAGESEDNIAAVIRKLKTTRPSITTQDKSPEIPPAPFTGSTGNRVDDYDPGNFWGGVAQSFRSGEALKAGVEGFGGFLKGAITDIPSTITGAISDFAESVSDPARMVREAPGAIRHGIPAVVNSLRDITARAGSDPETFGRTMGQLTGQPAVLAGAGTLARNPAASLVEGTGRIMRKHQPISGMLPRVLEPRIARTIERGAGGLVERAGQALRKQPDTNYGEVDLRAPTNTIPVRGGGGTPQRTGPPTRIDPRFRDTPIESADELAARGPEGRPSAFSEDVITSEADPMFQREAPSGPRLSTDKVPSVEEQFANLIAEMRGESTKQPSTQLPPAPYSLGERSAPTQPRITVTAPKTPRQKPQAKTAKTAETPTKPEFKPTTDPKSIVNTETGEILDDVASEFASGETGTTLSNEAKTAIKDFVKKKKGKGNWSINLKDKIDEFFKNESGEFDPDFWRREADPVDIGDIGETVDLNKAVKDLEPPPVSNRQMFDLSAQRGAEEAAARTAGNAFANQVLPNEFSQDMMFLPDEFAQADVPPMRSPVENVFDPRTAPGGVVSEPGLFEGTPLTFLERQKQLLKSETGAIGPNIKQQTISQLVKPSGERVKSSKPPVPEGYQKQTDVEIGPRGFGYSIKGPDGKPLGDIHVSADDLAEVRRENPVLEDVPDDALTREIYQGRLEELLTEHGYGAEDLAKMTVTKADNRKKPMKVEPEQKEPTFSTNKVERTEVDPEKAFGYGGDIEPIAREAARLERTEGGDLKFKGLLPENMRYPLKEGETFKQRLMNLLENTKEPTPEKLAQTNARMSNFDAELEALRNKQAESTFNVNEINPKSLGEIEAKMAERDTFLKSVEDKKVVKEPPLDLKKIDFRSLSKGRLNQQSPSPWISPKLQQQHPDLARKLRNFKK